MLTITHSTLCKSADELIVPDFFCCLAVDDTINVRVDQIIRKFRRRFSYTDATILALLERDKDKRDFLL